MIETEKFESPRRIAVSIGEGPRRSGRREGWILRIPSGSKRSRTSFLIITPNEARMPFREGFSDFSFFTTSRSDFSRA